MRLFVSMLLLAALCMGQTEDLMATDRKFNGRYWNSSERKEKINYTVGVIDALYSVNRDDNVAGDFTPNDYIVEIDKVYSDTENVNIPVIWVFTYCTAKLKGEITKSVLEARLMSLRKLAAAALRSK